MNFFQIAPLAWLCWLQLQLQLQLLVMLAAFVARTWKPSTTHALVPTHFNRNATSIVIDFSIQGD